MSVGEHCIAKNGTYESEKKMQWTKINKSNLATREHKERSLKHMPALFVRKGQKTVRKIYRRVKTLVPRVLRFLKCFNGESLHASTEELTSRFWLSSWHWRTTEDCVYSWLPILQESLWKKVNNSKPWLAVVWKTQIDGAEIKIKGKLPDISNRWSPKNSMNWSKAILLLVNHYFIYFMAHKAFQLQRVTNLFLFHLEFLSLSGYTV